MKTIEIFLPDEDTFRTMFETAFDKFVKQAEKVGHKLDDRTLSIMKEIFVAGYCLGFNDTLSIISDQMNADEIIKLKYEQN